MSRVVNIIYNTISGNSRRNGNVPIIGCNSNYGHEYWIKKYSKWKHPVYGVIEHGVYFGRNTNMVGDARDYLLKKIITFGDYREETLGMAFPEHSVIKIGPRIAYAETDSKFLKQLEEEAKGEKVLTLFPAHSLENFKCEYDVDYLISQARNVMVKYKLKRLRICLKEQDMVNGTAELFNRMGCTVVTAGEASIDFLPRLRAIIEASDVTMSNSLGTHLGYCIYLHKPHILIKQNRTHTGLGKDFVKEYEICKSREKQFQKEEKMFLNYFSSDNAMYITEEQYELCDYYWGFRHVKKPSEMYKALESLYRS
ncbi:hypothetical protein [uncultured Anaerovibrio sp.]|uniref:hypothetical protein n=1 Tax=uncultured Anaerovibrio sp. TaxID=361586 RepID=UPI0026197D7E|nr:hypothetical protein [uncultured Anaerovibrio sp.]